jgi:hypothetical protein
VLVNGSGASAIWPPVGENANVVTSWTLVNLIPREDHSSARDEG